MMYKVLNNLAPEYLKDLFRETNQVHDPQAAQSYPVLLIYYVISLYK
jgi:hypothetical protein